MFYAYTGSGFLSGHKKLWFLFAVLIIRSAGTGIQTPAVNAIFPQLVPKEHLMRMNGINSTLSSSMMFLSPAAGGCRLSAAPLEAALFIDVITAMIGISITFTIKIPPYAKSSAGEESSLQKITGGISYIKNHAFIRRLMLFQIIILFLISPPHSSHLLW